MRRTLADYPVELSVDAPKDKIILHPDIAAEIENRGLVMTSRIETKIGVTLK